MVSLGMGFSPETHFFGDVKLPPSCMCLHCFVEALRRCSVDSAMGGVHPRATLTVVMDIQNVAQCDAMVPCDSKWKMTLIY